MHCQVNRIFKQMQLIPAASETNAHSRRFVNKTAQVIWVWISVYCWVSMLWGKHSARYKDFTHIWRLSTGMNAHLKVPCQHGSGEGINMVHKPPESSPCMLAESGPWRWLKLVDASLKSLRAWSSLSSLWKVADPETKSSSWNANVSYIAKHATQTSHKVLSGEIVWLLGRDRTVL